MINIKYNQWYIIDNKMVASFLNYYVEVYFTIVGNAPLFFVRVVKDGFKEIYISFNTLEESINFIEKEAIKCLNLEEITEKYREYINDKEKVLTKER